MASLLGTGVIFLLGLLFNWRELDLVVSRRHGEDGILGVGVAVVVVISLSLEALEKKPRMLFCCCFPVVEDELGFLDNEGVVVELVGVPAALPGVRVRVAPDFSPILPNRLHAGRKKKRDEVNLLRLVDSKFPSFLFPRSDKITD